MSNKYIISDSLLVKDALIKLNESLGRSLFIVDKENKVIGSLTDGDIRRGLLKGFDLQSKVTEVSNTSFKFIKQHHTKKEELQNLKENGFTLIPLLDQNGVLISIIDLSKIKALLPLDAVIMAGGKGSRLLPLTQDTPKPLLKVGNKPILEHNIDRLASFGIKNVNITINYLGEQIEAYFKDGKSKNMDIRYVKEDKPLGTIGALKLIEEFHNDYILLMNSDLLTNIDLEDILNDFLLKEGDMILATIPYKVNIPYGVVETEDNYVTNLKEKPTYTYYSNAGIYIFKKECLDFVPENAFFNATDLIEILIEKNKKIINYPVLNYWLDIGKHEDYLKAQEDIKHINL